MVYFEVHEYINDAIKRESDLKAWKRRWKLELIETENKDWKDLFYEFADEEEVKSLREYFKTCESEKKSVPPSK